MDKKLNEIVEILDLVKDALVAIGSPYECGSDFKAEEDEDGLSCKSCPRYTICKSVESVKIAIDLIKK